jgi:small subunit ribosomal protein S14
MPRKSIIVKALKEPKYTTRKRRRCEECGRGNSVYNFNGMDLCRMHSRIYLHQGRIPGFIKAS